MAKILVRLGQIAGAISLIVGAAAVYGQTLPADVLACRQETDALERLECFDTAIARHAAASQPATITSASVPPPLASGVPARSAEPTAPVVASATSSDARLPKHVSATVVGIDAVPGAMVVTLDNGEVWEQVMETSGALALRRGERVAIDRQLGSYWLSDASGTAMMVRRKK